MAPAGRPRSRWRGLPAGILGLSLLVLPLAMGCTQGPNAAARHLATGRSAAALDRADALLFQGNYQGAEAAYRRQAAADPHAEAHLALLLAYESRYEEALGAAQAAVSRRPDSTDLAVLTRARDWAQDFDGALQSGAASIRSQPVSVLARLFYGEVLADAGLYHQASAQLVLAQAAAGDAYTRSELDREWANFYRDQGDVRQELSYFELSQRAQPAFPERTLELVRYDFLAGQASDARRLLAGLARRYSKRYGVLVSAADSAALVDPQTAVGLYQQALSVEPKAASASLGEAELDATKHQFAAAHDLLVPVLSSHPGAADVYLFLRYLDLLVLKRNPASDLAPATAAARQELARRQAQALARVNGYRDQIGVVPLVQQQSLAKAAEAHAYYVLFNWGASQLKGLGIHSETSALPGFTGVNGFDRSAFFGYRGNRESEVIDHVQDPASSVQTWADSVFHRFPLLDRNVVGAGFGTAWVGSLSVEVMEFGYGPTHPGVEVYPVPGQSQVPPQFLGNEIPDPAPGASYPIGYPVTIQAGEGSTLSVQSGSLVDQAGKAVSTYLVTPGSANPDLGPGQWALMATHPLVPGELYTVQASGSLNGAPFERRWSFRVAGL